MRIQKRSLLYRGRRGGKNCKKCPESITKAYFPEEKTLLEHHFKPYSSERTGSSTPPTDRFLVSPKVGERGENTTTYSQHRTGLQGNSLETLSARKGIGSRGEKL